MADGVGDVGSRVALPIGVWARCPGKGIAGAAEAVPGKGLAGGNCSVPLLLCVLGLGVFLGFGFSPAPPPLPCLVWSWRAAPTTR